MHEQENECSFEYLLKLAQLVLEYKQLLRDYIGYKSQFKSIIIDFEKNKNKLQFKICLNFGDGNELGSFVKCRILFEIVEHIEPNSKNRQIIFSDLRKENQQRIINSFESMLIKHS